MKQSDFLSYYGGLFYKKSAVLIIDFKLRTRYHKIIMTTNFDFLREVDKDLFEIITEAEKLYRDEYFEQCMAQTRRFGENVCKNVLGYRGSSAGTFDEMLAFLKDKTSGEEQEKEFIEDLYFLKRNGNKSVHSSSVKRDYLTALECLQRAFEVAISYSVYNRGAKPEILRLNYDTELLITGKPKQKTLAERYAEEKAYAERSSTPVKAKISSEKPPKKKPAKLQSYQMTPSKKRAKYPIFWILVGVTTLISLLILGAMLVVVKFHYLFNN